MKYVADGQQLTVAITTLSLVKIALDAFKAREGSPLQKQMKKIGRWMEDAGESFQGVYLSQGGRRAMDKASADYAFLQEKSGWPQERKWGGVVWTALYWLRDVRSGCPLYGNGPKRAAWRYLEMTLDTLGQAICGEMPEIIDDGYAAYCLMADIIYGDA